MVKVGDELDVAEEYLHKQGVYLKVYWDSQESHTGMTGRVELMGFDN